MKKLCLISSLCALGLLLQNALFAQDRKDSSGVSVDSISIKADSITHDSTVVLVDPVVKMDSTATPQTVTKKKSYWQTGLSYLSDNVYLGRKDSVKIPYIMPVIGYYHKSGLYIDASMGYAAIPGDAHIDMVAIEAGYTLSKGNFDGQLAASKYYYSAQSYSVRSEIKENIIADASYDLHFIKPTFEATFNFGNQTDYGIGLGLQHTFYAAGDALDLTPGLVMNSGTQNYYNSYYKQRKYSRTRKNGTAVKGTITATVIDPSAFKILDYEATMPINYTLGKFIFNFTPAFAIPLNPAMVSRITTPTGGTATTKAVVLEKLNNSFYWSLGFTYKF